MNSRKPTVGYGYATDKPCEKVFAAGEAGEGEPGYFFFAGCLWAGGSVGFSNSPPPPARVFLMRNQIAIASRSERIFASRWFERLIFIGRFAGEEDVGDFVAELDFC